MLREGPVSATMAAVEDSSRVISVGYSDPDINSLLDGIGGGVEPLDGSRAQRGGSPRPRGAPVVYSRHFNQNEEFFLKLGEEFTVPHFPIHHDIHDPRPDPEYLEKLKGVIAETAGLAPQVFKGLIHFFDPAEMLRPGFYKIFRVEERYYLYLLRIDLMMKPLEAEVVERGTNDLTPMYRSRKLFLESVIIPLDEVSREEGKVKAFVIKETVSRTWIGEQGRGYLLQGIWIDMDLTKFFSKLFLPRGKKTYPFFPFLCKYKTICLAVADLTPEGRKSAVPRLHRALQFLLPSLEKIQNVLRNTSFSEDMDLFRDLKAKVPEAFSETWKNIRVESYLNEAGMREFRVEN